MKEAQDAGGDDRDGDDSSDEEAELNAFREASLRADWRWMMILYDSLVCSLLSRMRWILLPVKTIS